MAQPIRIGIYNQKGGVGKTTTAVNLSVCLAALGHKTVLIDLDPQSSATSSFRLEGKRGPGVYELLNGECLIEDTVAPTPFENLFIVPSNRNLAAIEHALLPKIASQRTLREVIHFTDPDYRFLLVDCPPALGPLTANVLVAMDRLLVPVVAGRYAMEGVERTLQAIEKMRTGLNKTLELAGIVMLDLTSDEVGQKSFDMLQRAHGGYMFKAVVPHDPDVVKSTFRRVPVCVYHPKSPAAGAYAKLAAELLAGRGIEVDKPPAEAIEAFERWRDQIGEPVRAAVAIAVPTPAARAAARGSAARVVAAAVLGFLVGVMFAEPSLRAITAVTTQAATLAAPILREGGWLPADQGGR